MDRIDRWKGYLPDEELEVYRKAKFGRSMGMGQRPALLQIDTTYMFVDPAYAMCGHEDPALIEALTRITRTFRDLGLPIYYSRRGDRSHPTKRGMWNEKLGIAADFQYTSDPRADQWPEAYGPREQDMVVHKGKASCFFQTPLDSWLRYDGVDTVVIVGVSTSGCVRAAATDAFSHNFRVIVVEEACADRSPSAHKANLFDMDMKSADVEPIDTVTAELERRFRSRAAAE